MSSKSIQLKLVVKNGGELLAIYDDALVPLIRESVSGGIKRASHVEPQADSTWAADMSPVGGPILANFNTRAAALKAERDYINEHVIK